MFNPEVETKRIIEFIRDYYKSNNLGGVVLGISGGGKPCERKRTG